MSPPDDKGGPDNSGYDLGLRAEQLRMAQENAKHMQSQKKRLGWKVGAVIVGGTTVILAGLIKVFAS